MRIITLATRSQIQALATNYDCQMRDLLIERKKKIDEKEKQKQKEAVKQTSMLHFEGDVLPKLFSNLFRRILKFCQHSASENELIVRASTIVRLGGIYSTHTI